MSKDDSIPTGANAAVEGNDNQAQLKSLHYALVAMRSEQWQRPPTAVQIRVLQAFRQQYFPQPRQSRWLSWLDIRISPRTRMAFAGAFALVVLVLMSLLITRPRIGQTSLAATADNVSGLAEVRPAGSSLWYLLRPGRELMAGDRLRTGTNSGALIRFPDQSETQLEADTQVALLQQSTSDGKGSQVVVLHQYIGQTNHDIQPQNPDHSWFEVETSSASVTVVGTRFTVHVSDSQVTTISVEEGVVEVKGGETAIAVDSGQIAYVLPNSAPALGEPDPNALMPCRPVEPAAEPVTCEENSQSSASAVDPDGVLAGENPSGNEREGETGAVPGLINGSGSTSRVTPTPANGTAGAPVPGGGVPATGVSMTPSTIPTVSGSATAATQGSPTPTSTPLQGSATPLWTATPQPTSSSVPPSPTSPASPTWTPTAPPPSSTPVPPPPTSTPVPPPPTSTPVPPPPTSTPVPPTSTPVPPPPTSTPVPPPPTPTPQPTGYPPPPPTPTSPPYP